MRYSDLLRSVLVLVLVLIFSMLISLPGAEAVNPQILNSILYLRRATVFHQGENGLEKDTFKVGLVSTIFDEPLYARKNRPDASVTTDMTSISQLRNQPAYLHVLRAGKLRCSPSAGSPGINFDFYPFLSNSTTMKHLMQIDLYPYPAACKSSTSCDGDLSNLLLLTPHPQTLWANQLFDSFAPSSSEYDYNEYQLLGSNAHSVLFLSDFQSSMQHKFDGSKSVPDTREASGWRWKERDLERDIFNHIFGNSSQEIASPLAQGHAECSITFDIFEENITTSSISTNSLLKLTNFQGQDVKGTHQLQVIELPEIEIWDAKPPEQDPAAYPSNSTSNRNKNACHVQIDDGRAVFIEEGETMMLGFVNTVMETAMEPIMEQMGEQSIGQAAAPLTEQVQHAGAGSIAATSAQLIAGLLWRNLTNLLTDSLTLHVSNQLTKELTDKLGPAISEEVHTQATPAIRHQVILNLEKIIPTKINQDIPDMLSRTVPSYLTDKLTFTISHSLVPTLARTLSNAPRMYSLCYYCREFQKFCSDCNYMKKKIGDINYQSAYYVDYFAKYYAPYYTQAMDLLAGQGEVVTLTDHPGALNHEVEDNGPIGHAVGGVLENCLARPRSWVRMGLCKTSLGSGTFAGGWP